MGSFSILGALQVLAGVAVVIFLPAFAGIGWGLIIGGLASIGAGFLAPEISEPDDGDMSPVYGFQQFRNPHKASAVIPLIYSVAGIRTAPIWVQAWVTPRGHDDQDSAKTRALNGQGMSGVMLVCEGPVEDIRRPQFDGDDIFDEFAGVKLQRASGGTKYKIHATRVEVHSVRVYVDDVLAGWVEEESHQLVGFGDGTTTVFSWTGEEGIVVEKGLRFYDRHPFRNGGDRVDFELSPAQSAQDEPVPVAWAQGTNRILVNTQIPMPAGSQLWCTYTRRGLVNGIKSISRNSAGGISIIFYKSSKPTGSQVVTVDYKRKMIPGLSWEWRSGSLYDVPFRDAFDIKNTYPISEEIVLTTYVEYETTDAVDNTIFVISSGSGGFNVIHPDEGGAERRGAYAQFTIDMKLQGTPTGARGVFDDWQRVMDPAGKTKPSVKFVQRTKHANEFECTAESLTEVFWGYNIGELLKRFVERKPNDEDGKKRLAAFTRGRYQYRVKRTSSQNYDSNPDTFNDKIFLLQGKDVIDEFLSRPGIAKIKFEAVGNEHLSGRPPQVTVDVVGINNVKRYDAVLGRWVEDKEAQGNRVWAICDFVTNPDYGAGHHYSLDDIVIADALEVSAWLDEQIPKHKDTDEEESRSQLDCVIDKRKVALDWMKLLCLPARFFAFQSGTSWRFVKDDAVELLDDAGNDLVPVVRDDTIAGRTAKKSASLAHNSTLQRPTTLTVSYLREDEEFRQRFIQVTLEDTHEEVVRTQRADAFGVIRRTEAIRYARFMFEQIRQPGLNLGMVVSPQALDFPVGGVIRFISNRIGIDAYFRIFELSTDSKSFFVQVDARQYSPIVYEQSYEALKVIESGFKIEKYSIGVERATPVAGLPLLKSKRLNSTLTSKRVGRGGRKRRVQARARRIS